MWRSGLSNESPYMFSITSLCESPIPSASRPPEKALAVMACSASMIGCRGYVGTTAVPSSMRGTCAPTTASAVMASWPKICGSQNVA